MKRNAMSLKAIINNIAKENKVSAQSVLQTYMLERLLERISISKYKDNFILKGGMLISAMLGIDSRTTMDIDTTIKGFKLTEENIINIINEICNIKIDDGVTFEVQKIELIREDDDYGGYRITFKANYMESMPVIMKIDVTTGDKITYKEIKYCFDLMLEDRKIQIWSYNLETVIAEKFESIIKRGILGTRIRDYYDVYMLLNTQTKNINFNTLKDAIYSTAEHRNTINIIKDWSKIIEQLDNSDIMKKQWERYKKDNFYAKEIKYEDLIHGNEHTVITRAHFARALLEKGCVTSVSQAFDKYLGDGKKYYRPKQMIEPEEAIRLIRVAGGLPALAHPLQYKLGWKKTEQLLSYLKEAGMMGIEVYYSSHSQSDSLHLREIASRLGLVSTGGSDFHGANKPDIHLGSGYGGLRVSALLLDNIKARLQQKNS